MENYLLNFGKDDGAYPKSDLAHIKTLLSLTLKCKYCVNKSRDMSRDHFV